MTDLPEIKIINNKFWSKCMLIMYILLFPHIPTGHPDMWSNDQIHLWYFISSHIKIITVHTFYFEFMKTFIKIEQ